jgi:hypothetical protein
VRQALPADQAERRGVRHRPDAGARSADRLVLLGGGPPRPWRRIQWGGTLTRVGWYSPGRFLVLSHVAGPRHHDAHYRARLRLVQPLRRQPAKAASAASEWRRLALRPLRGWRARGGHRRAAGGRLRDRDRADRTPPTCPNGTLLSWRPWPRPCTSSRC